MSLTRLFFFFKYPATTEIYTYGHTLSLHDALPATQPSLQRKLESSLWIRTPAFTGMTDGHTQRGSRSGAAAPRVFQVPSGALYFSPEVVLRNRLQTETQAICTTVAPLAAGRVSAAVGVGGLLSRGGGRVG